MKRHYSVNTGGPRFGWFISQGWQDFTINPYDSSGILDQTETYEAGYNWDADIPSEAPQLEGWLGVKNSEVNQTVQPRIYADGNVKEGDSIQVRWPHTAESGYLDAGGFVANINLGWNGNLDGYSQHDIATRVVPYQIVEIADFTPMDEAGAAKPEIISMYLRDFFRSGFLDEYVAVVAVQYVGYNANYASISLGNAELLWDAVGMSSSQKIDINSVRLPIDAEGVDFTLLLEYTFFFCSFIYLIFLVINVYKLRLGFFIDIWSYLDLTSIIMSTLTVTNYWWLQGYLMDDFIPKNAEGVPGFPSITELSKANFAYRSFLILASLSALTIFLRVIKYLASYISRVRLLQSTMALASVNMFSYLCLVAFIFVGVVNFATINFGVISSDFNSFFNSLMTCLQLMMGDTTAVLKLKSSIISQLFFVCFMLFFFIICLQMFNAMINYAYNQACEIMEPDFERERADKRRRNKSGKKNPIMVFFSRIKSRITGCFRIKPSTDELKKEHGS